MKTHPLALKILTTLSELAGDDALLNCYGFSRRHAADGCPLDAAVFAWIDAGRPLRWSDPSRPPIDHGSAAEGPLAGLLPGAVVTVTSRSDGTAPALGTVITVEKVVERGWGVAGGGHFAWAEEVT